VPFWVILGLIDNRSGREGEIVKGWIYFNGSGLDGKGFFDRVLVFDMVTPGAENRDV
jgi:hypothetical protein